MQSFRGSIRLLRRHRVNTSQIGQFNCTRDFLSYSDSGLSTSKASLSVSDGISAANCVGFIPNFAIRSLSAVARESFRPGWFQWTAVVPNLSSRHLSTMGNPVESVLQDSSASISDVAPRIKFKRLSKTAKHIMQILDKEAVEEVRVQREIPDIKPGYIIQLKVEVPENKRRVSILKGIVIARRNAGLNTTFRVRRLVAGVGVESLYPLYSPNIKEIKVLDKKRVRRAKLYYLRDKMNALKKH
ncbi:large ribosomal subunit protein bL19cz-like [Malania oleifera]|uniref:large ribosomal subunit protein bL19cz-like n=1 Tax=Malania oleifera TaxID=397392 RepID=UPI0025ADB664|nr:large ribosomal subunit protein bL19cz-like [Malania oleifera]XP_057950684.1 large ribosomal subunit protein bL19cz-like [Malania oleifera]